MNSTWSGVIRGFGIDMPIRMAPANSEEVIELNYVCPAHSARVEQVFQCEKGLELRDIANLDTAFIREGLDIPWVVISEKDKSQWDILTGHEIQITESRPIHAFEPEWIVQSYWAWTDRFSGRPLASLWRALDREQLVALGTIVMTKRRYPVALRAVARGRGPERQRLLSVMRLHWPREIRRPVEVTAADAEPSETAAFRTVLRSLARVSEPMFKNLPNARVDAMTDLIIAREEADRKKRLAG